MKETSIVDKANSGRRENKRERERRGEAPKAAKGDRCDRGLLPYQKALQDRSAIGALSRVANDSSL